MVTRRRKASIEKLVREKKRRRECLVEGCREKMLSLGCCRSHYDAAMAIIAMQTTEEKRAQARGKLISDGLLLRKGEQPRKLRADSKAHVFRQSVMGTTG